MLPFLLLGALLLSPDQPIAPQTLGAFGAEIETLHTAANASRIAVAYAGAGQCRVVFPGAEGTLAFGPVVEGRCLALTATRDGFLLAYANAALHVVHVDNAGTLGIDRNLGDVTATPGLAALRSRALLFTPQELVVLNAEGRLVRRGIRVTEAELVDVPLVAANDESFLLAWQEGERVLARLASQEGTLLSEPVVVAERGGLQSIASDGRDFLVTWRSDLGLEGRIVSVTGRTASPPFRIAFPYVDRSSAAWIGGEYVVAYARAGGGVFRVPVSATGVAGNAATIDADIRANAVDVTSSAAGRLISWVEMGHCSGGRVARGSFNGGPARLLSFGDPLRHSPAAAAVNETFATAWIQLRNTNAVWLRLGQRTIHLSSEDVAPLTPAVVPLGDRVLVAWTANTANCSFVRRAAIVDGAGQVVKTLTIGEGSVPYTAATTNGTEFVVAWPRTNGLMAETLAARVSATGELLDAEPRVVVSERIPRFSGLAHIGLAVVWTGTEYLVVWQRRFERNDVQVQRLSSTLDVIGTTATVATGMEPRAAAGPAGTLIAWRESAGVTRALLLAHSGAVLISELFIAADTPPVVAAWGSEFVVAAGRSVVRVTPQGVVIPVTELPPGASDVAVAASGARIHIGYRLDREVYIRSAAYPRTRSVRR